MPNVVQVPVRQNFARIGDLARCLSGELTQPNEQERALARMFGVPQMRGSAFTGNATSDAAVAFTIWQSVDFPDITFPADTVTPVYATIVTGLVAGNALGVQAFHSFVKGGAAPTILASGTIVTAVKVSTESTVAFTNSGAGILLSCTGVAATNIRWRAHVWIGEAIPCSTVTIP